MRTAALLALAAALLAGAAGAHEIGTTQVRVLLRTNHSYRIDVITAPQALLAKLEAQAGQPRSSNLPTAEVEARLRRFAPELARAAEVRFDASVARPDVAVLPIASQDPNAPVFVTIRYSGEIPPRVSTFTWEYRLTYAAYAFSVETEGDREPATQWLDGSEPSKPYPLSRRVIPSTRAETARQYLVLGFTHILPYGLDHILFVLGIFLLTTKLRPVIAQVTTF
ncbi:MAG TPA: HupE/UreJ family protein, partial [Thermoanaerobaculia bacterium]